MATILPSLIVRVGSDLYSAKASGAAVADPRPLVAWVAPSGINQLRYSVLIANAEVDGTAYTTSGERAGPNTFFQVPEGLQLHASFNGLCQAVVSISQQSTGAFEYVSNPCYFVYDTNLVTMEDGNDAKIQWVKPLDPDNLPLNQPWKYHLQVSTDPLFPSGTIIFEDPSIPVPSGTLFGSEDLDAYQPNLKRFRWDGMLEGILTPYQNSAVFFRVRAWDGMDWGGWSLTGACLDYNQAKPTFEFVSAVPTGNQYGDVLITFTVTAATPVYATISFRGGPDDIGEPLPVDLVESTTLFTPGTWTVTWRTGRIFGLQSYDVVLYGKATDTLRDSNTDTYGPITVDDTGIQNEAVLGSVTYSFAIDGTISTVNTSSNYADEMPVDSFVALTTYDPSQQFVGVKVGKFAYWNGYIIGEPETNKSSGYGHDNTFADPGASIYWWQPPLHDKSNHFIYWPAPTAQVSIYGGPTWSAFGDDRDNPRVIKVDQTGFLFNAPVDNTKSSTIPSIVNSHDFTINRYLHGFIDHDGKCVEYPDGYDWNKRPQWHVGREVWKTGDAWLQVAHFKMTDRKVCQTCMGYDYVVSAGPPYFRLTCPNPNCQDGWDLTLLRTQEIGMIGAPNHKIIVVTSTYNDPQWYRLSRFFQFNKPADSSIRYGLPIAGGKYPYGIQFIMGRQVSNLDGGKINIETGLPTEWDPIIAGKTLTFAMTMPETWDTPGPEQVTAGIYTTPRIPNPALTIVVRQDDPVDVGGYNLAPAEFAVTEYSVDEMIPAALGEIIKSVSYQDVDPVELGNIVTPQVSALFGGANPSGNPLQALRYPVPTQPGSILVRGRFERSYLTRELSFRFLPAWWDAYQTLHVGQTGSATSQIQIQVANVNPDNSFGDWREVKGVGTTYNQIIGGWLTDPLVAYEYIDTSVQTMFPEGQFIKFRVRTFDPGSRTVSEWAYSHQVTILHAAANPVNFLSMVWDPWSKYVTITFRLDSDAGYLTNLTNFWFSSDDGDSWVQISNGDIYGSTTGLSPGTYSIIWNAQPYTLSSGDNYRLQIESLPTQYQSGAQLPYFRWFTPLNPGIDEAENNLANILGRIEYLVFDPTQGIWTVRTTPAQNPGQLSFDEAEMERIRTYPTLTAPDGIYSFITVDPPTPLPSGSIPDPSGAILPEDVPAYQTWLQATYSTSEHISDAMARVGGEIQNEVNVVIPQAQAAIAAGEKSMRRRLIDQGYYAEENFVAPSGVVVESIMADVVANDGSVDPGTQVLRQWTFRVQSAAAASDVAVGGVFNPQSVVTTFERVFFKTQFDFLPTYDSQQYGKPLREFLYDYDGHRLTMASFFGGTPIQDYVPNPALAAGTATPSSYPVQTIGGTMKIAPADLPGQHSADTLVAGQTIWDGPYYWQLAAYNAIMGPNKSRPRPQINSTNVFPGVPLMSFDLILKGNPNIVTGSAAPIVLDDDTVIAPDFKFSNAYLPQPIWADTYPINYVSDHRSPLSTSNQLNVIPWIPRGTNRPHPCIFWDEGRQMYMLYTSKMNNNSQWRVINSRGMDLPDMCEYEDYFADDGSMAIYRPCVVQAQGQYFMFVSVQPQGGSAFVGVSTSSDGNTWANVQPLAFVSPGINPAVVYDGTTFHLWYEQMVGGIVQITYATSTDGFGYTMQNGGAPVYGEASNVSSPSVIQVNGNWIMYLNDVVGNVISVFSDDGITWSGRSIELSPTTIKIGGTPTAVRPRNAFAFSDMYGGNNELFLIFNYLMPDNTNAVYVTRLEDRSWADSVPYKVMSQGDPLGTLKVSRTGVSHSFTADMLAHNLTYGQPIKVRMFCDSVAPAKLEFHRQSDWVDPTNLPDDQSYADPTQWIFNSALLAYPYLGL